MKILKPGKVEMRKFVCEKCGCEFVADIVDFDWLAEGQRYCPQRGCDCTVTWCDGEPYEEPAPTQSDREREREKEREKERLTHLLLKMPAFSRCEDDAAYLIANGVTFREDV